MPYAATRIGAITNALIPIYRARVIGYMVALAKSKVLVIPREFRGFDYPGMVEGLPGRLAGAAPPAGRRLSGESSWESVMATPWEERATVEGEIIMGRAVTKRSGLPLMSEAAATSWRTLPRLPAGFSGSCS